MKLTRIFTATLAAGALLAGCGGGSTASTMAPTRTIIMVWDGLRPDSVNATDTPNLYALRQSGVNFNDNHSTYPTFTMMNGSSFATGSFPKTSGFYGNTFWTPPQGNSSTIPVGNGASGASQDYQDPVFTEDYQVLTTLNTYYSGQLLLVKSLFATAQSAGLVTAAIGKSGAAYIQDLGQGGVFLDENTVQPRSLVTELQANGFALPANIVNNYSGTNAVTLAGTNGSPTAKAGYVTFNTTAYDTAAIPAITVASRDPTDTTQGEPADAANKYMMSVFTQYILPQKKPMLSLIWFRTPDNVEHGYGPGTANMKAGLRSQDARLGELIAALRANGMDSTTNIVVVSDHGHSSVSGPLATYPLRAITGTSLPNGALVNGSTSGITNAVVGAVNASGYSFSGDVRSADLLTYRGFNAYDGSGCSTSPMYGLSAAGIPTVPVKLDAAGTLCGAANTKYQAISSTLGTPVASFKVPAPASFPAKGIVVAANGGSDYFYVPGHDAATVGNLVKFLQQRQEYGAIFVDSRYGALPGTLSMAMVNLENATRQNNGQPDVVVSFNSDDTAVVQGMTGIEFESVGSQRGMHGSFGTSDVHNTLIANGPSFKPATTISNPSGNVDVAPTVAYLLGLSMPQADGRVLNEALAAPASTSTPSVLASTLTPASAATGLSFEALTDPTGVTKDATLIAGTYTINLKVKDLSVDGKTYRYFDYAKALRQ